MPILRVDNRLISLRFKGNFACSSALALNGGNGGKFDILQFQIRRFEILLGTVDDDKDGSLFFLIQIRVHARVVGEDKLYTALA